MINPSESSNVTQYLADTYNVDVAQLDAATLAFAQQLGVAGIENLVTTNTNLIPYRDQRLASDEIVNLAMQVQVIAQQGCDWAPGQPDLGQSATSWITDENEYLNHLLGL